MENSYFLEVQSILDKRINENGDVEFKIHWRGFDDSLDSWEPLRNLMYIKELIDDYENTRLKLVPNYIIEDEIQGFLLAIDNNNEILNDYYYNIASSNSDLQKPADIPLKIISLCKHKGEIYALIEWQVRSKTGIKPKNSYIKASKMKKDKHQSLLYLNYLETKIMIHNPI